MNTVLLQSFRTFDVPAWMTRCMASAQSLCDSEGWTYRFIDDALFDYVPGPIQKKLAGRLAMQSDIARLAWAKEVFLQDSAVDRVVWLDADVCVFAPEFFEIDEALDFAVGRQVWIQPGSNSDLKTFKQVHNAAMVFTAQSPVLDFLLHSVLSMAERMTQIGSPQMFGPKLLTAMHNIVGFDVIECVGMASPLVLRDAAEGGGPALDALISQSDRSLAALNLCRSYWNQTVDGVYCDDALYDSVITRLFSKQSGLQA